MLRLTQQWTHVRVIHPTTGQGAASKLDYSRPD